MVLESIMFGAWRHSTGLKLAKQQRSNIILVDTDMKAGLLLDRKPKCTPKLLHEVHDRKQILTCRAQRHIFGLHRRQRDLRLKFAYPQNGTTGQQNHVASAAANTVWILGMLMAPQSSKISIRITINGIVVRWIKNEALSIVPLK